jgi:hypothetical protein
MGTASGRKLEEDDVFTPLLFEDDEDTAHGNDWARGFMRGIMKAGKIDRR